LIETLKKLLPKNNFAHNISVIAGGTAAGQIIVVFASPLLTRLYSPDDFGILAVYSSFLGILIVVASLRYQLAIPLPKDDKTAMNLVALSLLIVIGMTVLLSLAIALFKQSIAEAFNTTAIDKHFWLLPLGFFFMGIYQVLNYWSIRIKAFPDIAKSRFIQSVSMTAIQLGGYTFGPLFLLIGWVFGHATSATILVKFTVYNHWHQFRAITLHGVIQATANYKRFPLFSTWGGLFNTAGIQLPPLLFAFLFSTSAAGLYLLAHRVLAMPIQLIGRAIAEVFFSQISEAYRKDKLAKLACDTYDKLANIALPPALLSVFLAPHLFFIIFGSEWKIAGVFAQWIIPWLFLQFVATPFSSLIHLFEKHIQWMFFHLLMLTARIAALLLGAWYNDLLLGVALFSIATIVCRTGYLVWVYCLSGANFSKLLTSTITASIWAIIIISPLSIILMGVSNSLFIAIIISISLIFMLMRMVYLTLESY